MADLLIKDMEVPGTCYDCIDSGFRFAIKCAEWERISAGRGVTARSPFCPLVEIPTHGRLIDASLFDVFAYGGDKANNEDFLEGMTYVLEMIDAAPTVIDARR